jgi:hypothetical protein
MKKVIFIVTALLTCMTAFAQDYVHNALLFSRTQPSGSARMIGLGGAQAALGGDYSAALINPAGLGQYNRSEVTITPALNFLSSTSTYLGSASPEDARTGFAIPGFSIVFNSVSNQREEGFLGGSFAISMTRTNDLHQDFRYRNRNTQNSIVDFFIEDAGTVNADELIDEYSLTGLAYNNYLIEDNYDDDGNLVGYGTILDFSRVRQEEISQRKGSQTQWSFAYGANFNDKLFVGASVGIASIRYKLSQVFKEDEFQYNPEAPVALDNFKINEDYDISGTGLNLTLGAIFRPVDFLQIGGSLVTPTYYGRLTDKYSARVDSEWNDFEYYQGERLNSIYQEFPEEQLYEYSFTTPMKANVGLAFISKFGFLTFNTEFVNYSKSKYRSDIAGEFQSENDSIRTNYKDVINLAVGIEFRHDIIRARLGMNAQPDPYRTVSRDDIDRSIKSLSAGFGVRLKKFFGDLGVIHSWTEARRYPYFTLVGEADPMATMKFATTKVLLTFGYTF